MRWVSMRAPLLAVLFLLPQDPEPVPTIRVLVHSGKTATVECRGTVWLRKPGVAKPLLVLAKLASSEVALADGRFRFLGQAFDEPWLALEARDPEHPIKLGNGRSYAGQLHFVRERGSLLVVNEVDLETYLMGVVGAEIGSGAPYEAMKAQAVCARSYAVGGMGGLPGPGQSRPTYDLFDDTRSQVYVGVPAANSAVKRAVRDTAGLFVTWRGRVVKTYFSSSCGGATQGVREWTGGTEIPPLSGVKCGFCEGVPNGTWSVKLPLADLTKRLRSRTNERPIARVSVSELSPSGRAAEVLVEAVDGKRIQMSGGDFAGAVGGRNRMFKVRVDGETVVLEGRGYGHGAGLCQYGAIGMAHKGKTCEEILAHYFPQSQLVPLYGPLARKAGRP